MDKIVKTDAQWQAELTPEQYFVTRRAGTERPFSGDLYTEERPGTYSCVCCQAHLFDADTKFDARCGWPSFYAEAAGANIQRIRDTNHGMIRVEVRCSHCDAHLGHVFPDGPEPTGERYCINSAALKFTPKA